MADSAPISSTEAAERWQRDGWTMVHDLVPAAAVATALDELERADLSTAVMPPRPPRRAERGTVRTGWSDDDPQERDGPAFRGPQFDGTVLFPIPGCPNLNRLFVHPDLIAFAKAALGTDDLRIYQSRVWSKRGDHTDYEQPMHRDGNHSLIPLTNEPGWWHLECFVYLHDVGLDNGAPGLVPGAVARAGLTERDPVSPDERPDLYRAEVRGTAGAGSVLAYRSDVWHRGRDLAPGTERHIAVVAFRPAGVEWVGFDDHARLVNHPDFKAFAASCTPDELALFGVPRPGHRYWSPAVIDGLAATYPGLDVTPWREAI